MKLNPFENKRVFRDRTGKSSTVIRDTYVNQTTNVPPKVEEKKCVEETYKEIRKATKEFGDAEINSIDEVTSSVSTYLNVFKELNLDNCPADYKHEIMKMQDELNSILALINSGEKGKAAAEKYRELTEINAETGQKIEELATSYGVNVDD